MIKQFHDSDGVSFHDRFQAWRTHHQDGVFLTLNSRTKANLHGIRCQHLGSGPPYLTSKDGFGSLTAKRKICGTYEEILAWATENGVHVKPCRDCLRENLIIDPSISPTPVLIDGADDSAIKKLLASAELQLAEQDAFDPTGITDARDRVLSAIVRRRGQPAFRKKALRVP